jgi:hypothetical protein
MLAKVRSCAVIGLEGAINEGSSLIFLILASSTMQSKRCMHTTWRRCAARNTSSGR